MKPKDVIVGSGGRTEAGSGNTAMLMRCPKLCPRCKKVLSADHYNLRTVKGRVYLRARCKACESAGTMEWMSKNQNKVQAYKDRNRIRLREYCKLYLREWRAKYPERNLARVRKWNLANPEKVAARIAVNRAVAKGTLKRPSKCSVCRRPGRIEGHHEDYSNQLEVIWLCGVCHNEADKIRQSDSRVRR